MKNWYYIEDCTSRRSEVYDEIIPAENATEAFCKAAGIWNRLTEHDRNERDEAYIGYADTDDDGCMDYDTMTDIYYIKRDGKTVYYLFDNCEGYGSEGPVCSDAVETARLLEGWNYDSEDPLPDEWHVAGRTEIEFSGTYDGTTDTLTPGIRDTEDD